MEETSRPVEKPGVNVVNYSTLALLRIVTRTKVRSIDSTGSNLEERVAKSVAVDRSGPRDRRDGRDD